MLVGSHEHNTPVRRKLSHSSIRLRLTGACRHRAMVHECIYAPKHGCQTEPGPADRPKVILAAIDPYPRMPPSEIIQSQCWLCEADIYGLPKATEENGIDRTGTFFRRIMSIEGLRATSDDQFGRGYSRARF